MFIPLTALAGALVATLQLWNARRGAFSRTARATASGALGQACSQVLLGVAGLGSAGLNGGYLMGRVLNLAVLARRAGLGRTPARPVLARVARSHSAMPRWLMPTVVLNLVGTTAIAPWVAHSYGVSVAGAFALAMQMLSVPAALLGQAVGSVLLPKWARSDRAGAVEPLQMQHYARALGLVSIAAFLPVFMLGPSLFGFVFGAEWEEAGVIASILAPWLAVNFVSSPLSSFAVVKRRFRRVFFVAFLETTARLAAIGVGALAASATLGFWLYSATGVAICLFSLGWILHLAGTDIGGLISKNWPRLIGALLGFGILLGVRIAAPTGVIIAVTGAVMAGSVIRALRLLRT